FLLYCTVLLHALRTPLLPSSLPSQPPPTPVLYTLSLHDALPICFLFANPPFKRKSRVFSSQIPHLTRKSRVFPSQIPHLSKNHAARKSTRLNSSHVSHSYAVFCLKQKNSTLANSCAALLPHFGTI